jgi:hypothetical protein
MAERVKAHSASKKVNRHQYNPQYKKCGHTLGFAILSNEQDGLIFDSFSAREPYKAED